VEELVIVLFLGLELVASIPKMIPNHLKIERKIRKCRMKCTRRKSNYPLKEMLAIQAGAKGVHEHF